MMVVPLPLVAALIEPGSRYSATDRRIASVSAPKPIVESRRGRPRGPSAKTIAKLWGASGYDRAAFRRALEVRLRRAGLLPRSSKAELERVLGDGGIDAPFA